MSRRIQTRTAPATASAGIAGSVANEEVAGISFTDTEELALGPGAPPSASGQAASSAVSSDGYIDRLIKYIPSEIIALYLGATNVVPVKDPSRWTALWIITGLCVVCTPIYMYLATKQERQPTLWSQIAISSIAFPVWVFAIGGPFRSFPWYDEKQWIAAIIITFGTFLAGVYKPEPAAASAS